MDAHPLEMHFKRHMPKFVHELPDAKALFETLAEEMILLPNLVEKDYWAMHCLWGLKEQEFGFELKGGTSLSKGWNCIDRFSEDIDMPTRSARPWSKEVCYVISYGTCGTILCCFGLCSCFGRSDDT